jgi:hypothetical protein
MGRHDRKQRGFMAEGANAPNPMIPLGPEERRQASTKTVAPVVTIHANGSNVHSHIRPTRGLDQASEEAVPLEAVDQLATPLK